MLALGYCRRRGRKGGQRTVTSKLDLVEGQATLRAPCANDTGTGESTTVVLRMVGHIKVRVRVFLEALLAVPSHVLQRRQGAICREQEIEIAYADERIVDGLDNVCQHPILRGAKRSIAQALVICGATEDVGARALLPFGGWGVDCFLDIAAVEVNNFGGGDIVAWIDAASLAP